MYKRVIKPVFDRILAFILIVILIPVWLPGLAIIFIYQGGPIFFVQQRSGRNLRSFKMYKLRTLETSHSTDLSLSDRTYSRLGMVLRKYSLDELPQLFNILKGEMSFVGPRPLPVEYDKRYDDFQKLRFRCRPGLTGWAQVHGRNDITWNDKFAFDKWYVDNVSLFVDVKIFFLTFFKLFQFEGIKEMSVFTGSKMN